MLARDILKEIELAKKEVTEMESDISKIRQMKNWESGIEMDERRSVKSLYAILIGARRTLRVLACTEWVKADEGKCSMHNVDCDYPSVCAKSRTGDSAWNCPRGLDETELQKEIIGLLEKYMVRDFPGVLRALANELEKPLGLDEIEIRHSNIALYDDIEKDYQGCNGCTDKGTCLAAKHDRKCAAYKYASYEDDL